MAKLMSDSDNDEHAFGRRRGHNGAPAFVDTRDEQNTGWVRIQRSIRTHWLVGFGSLGKHSRSEAWQDLIMECRYEDGMVTNGGRRMPLMAGQMLGAVSWLAQRWKWTPKEVRGFLEKLEKDGMISMVRCQTEQGHHKGKQANIITLENYAEFQLPNYLQGQAKGQAEGKSRASEGQVKGDIYKDNHLTLKPLNQREDSLGAEAPASEHQQLSTEVAEPVTSGELVLVGEVARPQTYRAAFDDFWSIYPRKIGKGAASAKFLTVVGAGRSKPRTTIAAILEAAKRFRDECRGRDPKYIPHAATWLNQGRWDDEPDVQAIDAAFEQSAEDPFATEQTASRNEQRAELLRRMRGEADDG